jgi:uncharacterized ferritin-like protein (DUF455 family)
MPPPASPLAFSIHALRLAALDALCASDIHSKQAALQDCVLALSAAENANAATAATTQTEGLDSGHIPEPLHLPGRPARPELRPHRDISTASLHTPEGLPRLLHSIAHIEFNAINLALDAVWRFAAMPLAFYADWLQVAHEEAYHFKLLQDLLLELGYAYGDFPAHTGLWEMTEKTKADITARMALVPRTLEARGLDATPPMQARLRKLGTPVALKAVAVLDIILRDEVGHVRIGNHWYGWLCARQGLDPVAHYQVLTEQYQAPRLRAPFNEAARLAAGFSAVELAALQEVALQKPSTMQA